MKFGYRKLYIVIVLCSLAGCQPETYSKGWSVYKGDAGSSSYSSLDQINKDNVDQLEIAWSYRTGDLKEDDHTMIETNPIIVDDILYGVSPKLKVFALDAATGTEAWRYDPYKGQERGRGYLRSVVYWQDGADKRILFTAGTYLFALDAETGTPAEGFGSNGKVNLNIGLKRNPEDISVKATSPGIIYEDLLILGSAVGEGYESAPGDIRAYDVRSGEIVWTFHTIPRPGEPGSETWAGGSPDSLQKRGGANSWAGMSLDKERGVVFIPLGSPIYDFYGGNRTGKNLYGNSLLALNAATGEYQWHFQTVHHDLWDYDLPAPPNLVTLEHEGEEVEAIAQVTKSGFTYIFNRETGKPLYPVEEKPVPSSQITEEEAWPTQPFPTTPEPFTRQKLTSEDLATRSPEIRDSVMAQWKSYRYEGLFTPPDPAGTVLFPSTRGGANWGGAAYDPETDLLFVNANETAEISTVRKVRPEPSSGKSLDTLGEAIYTQNCATCHGVNLKGRSPLYPSLENIAERRSEEEVVTVIEQGGGRMPAFNHISEKKKEAIIAFLFEEQNRTKGGQDVDVHKTGDKNENSGRFINLTAYGRFEGPDGLPAIRPPWGTLNAIDLNTGKIRWRIPLGTHPALKSEKPTGVENWGGPIATAGGLVFIGATKDRKFRAFDKDTGELLWETTLPTGGFATPATYLSHGKQYVVIAAGGGRGTKPGDYYIAFSLPDSLGRE